MFCVVTTCTFVVLLGLSMSFLLAHVFGFPVPRLRPRAMRAEAFPCGCLATDWLSGVETWNDDDGRDLEISSSGEAKPRDLHRVTDSWFVHVDWKHDCF